MADIELVIKIDEKTYRDIKNGKVYSSMRDVPLESVSAIANGTLLPKGHGRLVDVDEYFNKFFNDAREFLDMAQTIVSADNEVEKSEESMEEFFAESRGIMNDC